MKKFVCAIGLILAGNANAEMISDMSLMRLTAEYEKCVAVAKIERNFDIDRGITEESCVQEFRRKYITISGIEETEEINYTEESIKAVFTGYTDARKPERSSAIGREGRRLVFKGIEFFTDKTKNEFSATTDFDILLGACIPKSVKIVPYTNDTAYLHFISEDNFVVPVDPISGMLQYDVLVRDMINDGIDKSDIPSKAVVLAYFGYYVGCPVGVGIDGDVVGEITVEDSKWVNYNWLLFKLLGI